MAPNYFFKKRTYLQIIQKRKQQRRDNREKNQEEDLNSDGNKMISYMYFFVKIL